MPEDSNQSNPWKMAHMGLEFAGAALLLGAIGWYIDYTFSTFPVGAITGLILGLVGGGYRFLRMAILASRENMRQYRRVHPLEEDQDKPDEAERNETGAEGRGRTSDGTRSPEQSGGTDDGDKTS